MKDKQQIPELLERLEWLYEKYSHELRANTQPYHLQKIQRTIKAYEYTPDDAMIRESLLEHIGALPMLATTIYPYINDDTVDLGKALTMLAIHDIGELVTGDEIMFTKKIGHNIAEQRAALNLLDPSYHSLYKDMELQTSQTAKFAKAIDRIAGIILGYLTPPAINSQRLNFFVGVKRDEIVPLYIKHVHPYMLWNSFMTEFHEYLIDKTTAKLKAK